MAALPYIQLENELSNYFVNHVKNGFSAGHVINMNMQEPDDEMKGKIVADIKRKLTGSSNAGEVIVSFNSSKDYNTTVERIEVSDAHSQYNWLCEFSRDQICVAHKVISGAILGIAKGTGFSSNAEEIETAFNETMINIITPKQELLCDNLEAITGMQNLAFIPLRKSMADEAKSAQIPTQMAKHEHETDGIADALIDLGEEVDNEEWEVVLENDLEGVPENIDAKLNLSAKLITNEIDLARDFASFWKDGSEQDTSLFKVRYKYDGAGAGEREFCQKMMKANKVYRKEDIDLASDKVVNKGFGPRGADTYNIWLYKGGVNCQHRWIRVIYLRKGNKKLSVYEARKMLMKLDPDLREKARWKENEKEVAQVASEQNNYWKLD